MIRRSRQIYTTSERIRSPILGLSAFFMTRSTSTSRISLSLRFRLTNLSMLMGDIEPWESSAYRFLIP